MVEGIFIGLGIAIVIWGLSTSRDFNNDLATKHLTKGKETGYRGARIFIGCLFIIGAIISLIF